MIARAWLLQCGRRSPDLVAVVADLVLRVVTEQNDVFVVHKISLGAIRTNAVLEPLEPDLFGATEL